jgi:hypothetical protein
MKKKLIFVPGVLLFFCFVSANCFAQSSTNDQRIVGTWIGTYTIGDTSITETLLLNANGSGTITANDGKGIRTGTFTYGISSGGEINYIYSGNSTYTGLNNGTIYFSPDGKTLILNNNIYRKK